MKMDLLRIYISCAPDPLKRPTSRTGKGEYSKNFKVILNQNLELGIYKDGEKFPLDNWTHDGLAQVMQLRGLKKQKQSADKAKEEGDFIPCGLAHIIDEWLESGVEIPANGATTAFIRESADEIIAFAIDRYT